jgi:hypothetical protein
LAAAQPAAAVADFELEFAESPEVAEPIEAAMVETVAELAVEEPVSLQMDAAAEPELSAPALACTTSERAPFEADAAVEPVEHDQPVEHDTPTLEQIAADEAALDAEAAHDIAVLDMVAQEMSAPDDDDMADFDRPTLDSTAAEVLAVESMSFEATATAAAEMVDAAAPIEAYQVPPPAAEVLPAAAIAEPAPPAVMAVVELAVAAPSVSPPPTAAVPQPAPPPVAPSSLGAAVLAHGAVRKPILASDPLAALRRMTQAEKLAFFS